jgi:hypothetical protein
LTSLCHLKFCLTLEMDSQGKLVSQYLCQNTRPSSFFFFFSHISRQFNGHTSDLNHSITGFWANKVLSLYLTSMRSLQKSTVHAALSGRVGILEGSGASILLTCPPQGCGLHKTCIYSGLWAYFNFQGNRS